MDFALIDQADGVHVIIVAVHHGALDVQLVVVCHGQIYSSHVCENCYQDDDASFSGIFDGLSHGDVIAGAVIDHIRFIRAESIDHGFSEILIFRIHAHVNAAFLCFFQTQVADVSDHDLGGAHSLGSLRHQVADRACADDYDIHTGHIAHLFYPMYSHCQRFDHGSLVIGHLFRDRCHLGSVHGEIF